jgi:hypothetical protein
MSPLWEGEAEVFPASVPLPKLVPLQLEKVLLSCSGLTGWIQAVERDSI